MSMVLAGSASRDLALHRGPDSSLSNPPVTGRSCEESVCRQTGPSCQCPVLEEPVTASGRQQSALAQSREPSKGSVSGAIVWRRLPLPFVGTASTASGGGGCSE